MKHKRFEFKYYFNLYSVKILIVYYNKNHISSMIVTTNIVDGTKQIWFLNKDIEIIKFVKQSVSDEEVFDWFAQAVEKEKDVLYKDRDGDPYAEDAKWWKYCPNCFEPIMSSKEDEVN